MTAVDIFSGAVVHRARIEGSGRRATVAPCCDHDRAEQVLAALTGTELHCEWPARIFQHLLRRRVPLAEAARWAALPVNPTDWHPITDWETALASRAWTLGELEAWRRGGWTPDRGARLCRLLPRRPLPGGHL